MIERFENITADKCLKMTVVKALDGKLLVTLKDECGSLLNDMFDTRDIPEQASSSKVQYSIFNGYSACELELSSRRGVQHRRLLLFYTACINLLFLRFTIMQI